MTDSSATFGRPAASAVEAAGREYVRALVDEDSVFTPGEPIWTLAHATELMEHFVAATGTPGSSFDDKLVKQLEGVSRGACQLFAELYCLDLLPLVDFREETKRRYIQLPLETSGIELTLPPVIDTALQEGVLGGGAAFKTRRFWQLSYLVQFTAGFLKLSATERSGLVQDPVAFRDMLDSLDTVNAPSQRGTLLYLFFPAFYLPVSNPEHRAQMRAAFVDELDDRPDDADEALARIYQMLSDEAGAPVDLYQAPYRERWDPKALASTTYRQDPWQRFLSWAHRVAESFDLEREERDYKLELARRLADLRGDVVADEPGWTDALRSALGSTNLIGHFFLSPLFDGLREKPDQMREVLLSLWRDDPDPQLLTGFRDQLANVLERNVTPGDAVSLGSVLLMARDGAQYPPYRPTPVDKARSLTQTPSAGRSPAERYEDLLMLCDELLDRASDHDLELRDRLDAQGLIWAVAKYDPGPEWSTDTRVAFLKWRGESVPEEAESTQRRAWLIRGSNVHGRDLAPTWLAKGSVSLAGSRLREVDAGMSREDLKPIIDEDYAHTSYSARQEKLDEVHQFLTRIRPGDLVATTSQGRLYLGEITGEPEFVTSRDGRSNLRRNADWNGPDRGVSLDNLPQELRTRLQAQHDVLDLTQQLDPLDALRTSRPVEEMEQQSGVRLRDATPALAARLYVGQDWLQQCIDLLHDRPQLVFYGPPGTGKTYLAMELAHHLAGDNVKLVQFHPAYSYEDFFEGYRPTPEGGFKLTAGPMRRIVDQATENPSTPYVLIIDEINRGNLAKVFGELYFLLEYREQTVDLMYATEQDKGFALPANVFIIGTMNTADRSIALVDTAMRRRFAFLALHPASRPTAGMLRRWLAGTDRPSLTADLLDELNQRIEDPDFKVGPSYFMRPAVYEAGGLQRTWDTAILPLLEEHHYGDGVDVEKQYGLSTLMSALGSEQASVVDSDEGDGGTPSAG